MTLSSNPLKRPFPDREFGRSSVIGMARVGVFVFAFLYLMRPWGVRMSGNPLLICLGYGLVTFIVGVAYAYTTTRLLGWEKSGDRWTLWRWILDSGLLLACISVGNFFFYNATVGWTAFHILVLAAISVPTVLIGLFPIAASGMALQLRAEREHQRVAGQVLLATSGQNGQSGTGRLTALGDGSFSVDPTALLFCESRQNYVRCVYLSEGAVREETIRATLSGVEERLKGSMLLRCHRSYLINVAHIRQARGNAQGLRLELVGTEEEVPVSRAYVPVIREAVVG
ncbi:MAG: LytTR family DNA-binding domain-containing protein [Bacteroidota bacterium]